MYRFAVNHRLLIMVWIGVLAGAGSIRGAQPAAVPGPDAWAPPLYGFCIETHDAKKRTLPEQASLLCELGFPGVGYPLWLDGNLERNLHTLDAAGLKVFLMHTAVNVNSKEPPYDPRLPAAIRQLKGRPVTVCVLLRGFKPGDPQGEANAVAVLRQLGDVAAEAGLRISIYHHVSDWTESLLHALQVVRKTDHPQVGVNFNLCHWLKIDGARDYRPVLRENADKIFAVTINGAQVGSNTWTDGLIQPLDRGDFDNRQLLATLREIGYRGPIGLMCYGIQGDAREHLERSMKVWKSWE
jgi:sugar phosphate isomerase/epimerase